VAVQGLVLWPNPYTYITLQVIDGGREIIREEGMMEKYKKKEEIICLGPFDNRLRNVRLFTSSWKCYL
jgi:hypothetical protein